jgi:thiol-disulfide isomerase/thioredoxin
MQIILADDKHSIHVLNFHEFEPYLHFNNDTTYVINFWATWCVPCIKELPEFEKFHKESVNKKIKVLLVSLDSPSRIENSLLPFIEKHNISAEVLVLNDPNHNAWIDKVDPSWSGSLPATVIYTNSKREFFEMELDYNQIKNTVNKLSNL